MRSKAWLIATAVAFALGSASPAAAANRPTFDELDVNKDGMLSKAEAAKAPQLNFATADTNKDGQLSPSEYDSADG